MEHAWLTKGSRMPPPVHKLPERGREDQYAPLTRLVGIRPKTDYAAYPIHVTPLQRQDFSTPPTRHVPEVDSVPVWGREVRPDGQVLGMLEEALAGLGLS
jgi:hypothetical protein